MKSGSSIHKYYLFIILGLLLTVKVFGGQEDRIIFNHSFHIEDVELSCEECHDGVGTYNEFSFNVFPEMDFCLNCHDGDTADDDCEKCHTNADEPLAISDSWVISGNYFSHKSHLMSVNACEKCHGYILEDDGTNEPKIWQKYECNECHSQHEYVNDMTACTSCHIDFHKGNNGKECQLCHTPGSWAMINATDIHQTTRFPLVGPHVFADCEDCHTSASFLDFEPIGVDCFNCHSQDYLTTHTPNHVLNNIAQECEECHSMTSYSWDLNFAEHSIFPLIGGHSNATCYECHTNSVLQNIDAECYSCHQLDYNSTSDPDHRAIVISTNCEECHTTNPGWQPVNIDHDVFYVLTGVHVTIIQDCQACHINGYSNTSSECYSCHQLDYNSTQDPDHDYYGFSTDCENCHGTDSGWSAIYFNHNTYYPLSGAHSNIENECNMCHTQGYDMTSDNCYDCHSADYNSASDPNHLQYQFPQDCNECHNTSIGWTPIILDHNSVYPLIGAHELVDDCIECHNTSFNNLLNECSDCHISNYNSTVDPNHINEQFPLNCDECHSTNPGWTPIIFDHNTVFTFTGAHSLIQDDCSKCHSTGYSNIGTDCLDCHINDYNNTSDPNHIENQFSTACEDCHTTNPGWSPASIDHSLFFELTGAHESVQDDCLLCHSAGYANTSSECLYCHMPDYNSTSDPNHLQYQFPTNCEECHSTNPGWTPIIFDHNSVYPLLGAHVLVGDDCLSCHNTGFNNLQSICEDCHISDYNNVTDPNHITNQFPKDCSECHSTNVGWTPIIFDHNTVFALTGAHSLIQDECIKCHNSGYTNISSECSSCHIDDYNATSDPNHLANQFPLDCELCHTTSPGWTPTTFDHDGLYFPIYSGDHRNKWDNCSTCHINSSNYAEFSCFNCHKHNQSNMNQKHNEVDGYVYNSYACYDCHPNGDD